MKIHAHSQWCTATLGMFFFTAAVASITAPASVLNAKVTRNVDGDTIWVEKTGQSREYADAKPNPSILKIRMLGMDAPESCFPTAGGCVGQGHFGTDSKEKLAELVPVGTRVRIDEQGLDTYKRTLANVLVGKTDINLRMVELGLAIPYVICTGPTCDRAFFKKQNVSAYLNACHKARTKKVGIWNPKDPLREMPFEFRLRLSGRDPNKYVGDFRTQELFEPDDYKSVDVCDRIFFMTLDDAESAGYR